MCTRLSGSSLTRGSVTGLRNFFFRGPSASSFSASSTFVNADALIIKLGLNLSSFVFIKLNFSKFKSFLDKHNLVFDEQLLGGQDRDFFQRVLLNNPEMLVINDYLTTYLKHNASISENIYKQGNFKITQSRVRALISFIKRLQSEGRLSPSLRRFYTAELRKMIPLVHKDLKTTKSILKALLKLSSPNFETLKNWCKVSLGLTSLMITGKGQKLFK